MSEIVNIPLFPVPLFKLKVTNHEKIKKYLMDTIHPHFLKNEINDKYANVYTDYIPGAVKAPWKMLNKFYEEDIEEFLKATGIDFSKGWSYKFTCWYGMMTETKNSLVHDHTGGPSTIQWSGVHYVVLDTDKDSGGTIFNNPNARMMKGVIPTKNTSKIPDLYRPNDQQCIVEEGDLVMFPSWLDHRTPDHSGSLRVIVAMNIMLKYTGEIEGY
jgi:hypothetical protein